MRLFKRLQRKLDYLTDEQKSKIEQAFILAEKAHKDQKRRTGEPYITHPVAVACILADMKMEPQSIMAALLHDTIEDTDVTKANLIEIFGEQVAALVDGVTKLTQIEFVTKQEEQADNFLKMVFAMSHDIRVIIVKLADRLHNMRTMGAMPVEKRRRKARETLEIYAPIAKRLGMRNFSVELEDLGFAVCYPARYRVLNDALKRARGHRKKVLSLIDKSLKEAVDKSDLKNCIVEGREKHLYSIYRKMQKKHMQFSDVMDVYAYRIIVDKVDTCYLALGLIHRLFKPVPERFKDYIAIPKANGYQSLHTTLFGPYGFPIEVQIRTREMDRMATSGVAAHWLYKSADKDTSQSQMRAEKWVHNLLELQQSAGSSLEFIETVKFDLFPDEVYVFTPKGKIMSLPSGSTPVDFAYFVHTDIGNACVAAKVDRQLSPLSKPLINGQTVEVITAANARPNPAWLDFVVTGKARGGIRHYLKSRRRVDSVSLGKQLLKQALRIYHVNIKSVPGIAIEALLHDFQLDSKDALFEEVGLGNRLAQIVAKQIATLMHSQLSERDQAAADTPLVIMGTEGMAIQCAGCCCPMPGDPVVGLLNSGHGVEVHRAECDNISMVKQQPEQMLALRWAEDVMGDFKAMIQVDAINIRGILATMALAISDADANIDDIILNTKDHQHVIAKFALLVHNREHLAKVFRRLRQLKQILKITRL